MSESAHKSVLALQPRTSATAGVVLAVLFHVTVFGAAFWLPKYFEKPHPIQKPIIAKLVAQGKPRDQKLLPRKESPPPPAAAAPVSPAVAPVIPEAPSASKKPTLAPPKPEAPAPKPPSRQQLMERALARAAGKAEPRTPSPSASKDAPDPERAGKETGSPQGTAATAEEGDEYFSSAHDAIQENYVVPSVISERERMYLSATVLVYIGPQGQILKHEITKKSGNPVFDQALELAVQRTKLPPPPAAMARELRDSGIELNFKP